MKEGGRREFKAPKGAPMVNLTVGVKTDPFELVSVKFLPESTCFD